MTNNSVRNARIRKLREDGIGPRDIAALTGVTPGVVAGVLFRAKMTSQDKGGRGNGVPYDTKKKIVSDRLSGMLLREVADKWGYSPQIISQWTSRMIFGDN